MGQTDDAGLVADAVAGDRAAFETLLRAHHDRIHGLAWQFTGSRADADDIAQDVCCTLVRKIADFRGEARFSTWLTSIVVNACRDHHRRRRSFAGFAEKLTVLAGIIRDADRTDPYDAVWARSAIARLKPPYRETAVLVAGQQLTHAEAAAILGTTEATVAWRMHKIRAKLVGDA